MKKWLILIILLLAIILIAWHRVARGDTTHAALKKKKPDFFYCPPISAIKKRPIKMTWYAQMPEGLWKSYGLSFANKITSFAGAQWTGEVVGQIFCVYHAQQSIRIQGRKNVQAAIPIILVFGTLSPVPTTKNWTHPKRGVRDCVAKKHKLTECPFKINMKPKQGNIYDEAASLKS